MLKLNLYRYEYLKDRPVVGLITTEKIIYLNKDNISTVKLLDRVDSNFIYELSLPTGIYIGASEELEFMTGNKIFVAKE